MSWVLTVPQPWFGETTSELSFGLLARTAVESSCGGGFIEGHWTRASMETITFFLHKLSIPSLCLFLWLLLGLEARSSNLGVLGLWFPYFSIKGRTISSEIQTPSQLTLFHVMRWSWDTQPGFHVDGSELEGFL